MDFSKKDILGIFFVAFAILAFLSLISYSVFDPSFNSSYISGSSINNIAGVFGSYVSDILLQVFGVSSFILPFVLILLSVFLFFRTTKVSISWVRILISFLILLTFSISMDVLLGALEYGNGIFPAGGFIGKKIASLIIPYLGKAGAGVVFVFITILLSLYVVNFSFYSSFTVIFYFLYKTLTVPFIYIYKFVSITYKFIRKVYNYINGDSEKLKNLKIENDKYENLEKVSFKVRKKATKPVEILEEKIVKNSKYSLPPLSILRKPEVVKKSNSAAEFKNIAGLLANKLTDFGVDGEVVEVCPGPVITMYEFAPAPGVKINKVANLSDDLALALGCGSVRVIAPIPGKSVIGIEVPNKNRDSVLIRELISSNQFSSSKNKIPIAIGKTTEGETFISDLTNMPHLLVAGTTGSGKSVFINSLICSILYKFTPEEVKLILVDPKMLELSTYENIPHLLLPVVTDPAKASKALKWAVREMTERYSKLSAKGARNIESYNKVSEEKMPYIIIIVDELSDLMMVSSKDVETSITRLAQMARAAGIHLIVATQRPSVDVITGLIKANFPARIAFKVSSRIDSRTILDTMGSEKLLGKGDMLFLPPNISRLERLHGAFISDEEIKEITDYVRAQGSPSYNEEILKDEDVVINEEEYDELYEKAVEIVLQSNKASISYIQRKLKIGYNRAARIMELMEAKGIVSGQLSSGQREILIDR